jgi:hypothetical protein
MLASGVPVHCSCCLHVCVAVSAAAESVTPLTAAWLHSGTELAQWCADCLLLFGSPIASGEI